MSFFEEKGISAEENEDESFVIELLNARERWHGDGNIHGNVDTKETERWRYLRTATL